MSQFRLKFGRFGHPGVLIGIGVDTKRLLRHQNRFLSPAQVAGKRPGSLQSGWWSCWEGQSDATVEVDRYDRYKRSVRPVTSSL